jgi:hypothetical protein
MNRTRARILMAMGLPVLACGDDSPPPKSATVELVAPSATTTAIPSATATASATIAEPTPTVVETTPQPTATVTAPPVARGLSNVPNFSTEYPHQNNRGCSTAYAHCYLLGDLKKTASVTGASCPSQEDVPDACGGGTPCRDPSARTTGALLPGVSRTATAQKHASACCYEIPDTCCAACGRALRDGDRACVTPSMARSDWTSATFGRARDAERAARFSSMAAAEHASIASFARTSLELLALGAPPDLIADTHRAALDEIEHARIAYALAAEASSETLGPAPLAMPSHAPPTFASMVASTFLDACVGESLGVAQIRELAAREIDARTRARLERIAEDEERHVVLAFRTLAWAVRAGGASAALVCAIDDLDAASRAHPAVRDVVLPCARALVESESHALVREARAPS